MSDSEDLKILAEELVDFCNAVEAAVVKLRTQIQKLLGIAEVEKRRWGWNPEAIKWEKAEGFREDYERSEDVNNLEFKAMLKDLAQHGGKLSRNGFFYWVFKNGYVVGRKKR
ncbi:MAG: hypothetical protein ACUVTB_07905 [Candidatus Bathycorpusculaceae bacterium]